MSRAGNPLRPRPALAVLVAQMPVRAGERPGAASAALPPAAGARHHARSMVDTPDRTPAQPSGGQELRGLPRQAGADVTAFLDDDAVARTADSIVEAQLSTGQIPWFPGGQTDPWDHVES